MTKIRLLKEQFKGMNVGDTGELIAPPNQKVKGECV